MNGAHDVGGMHGFGAVDVDADSPFHGDLDRLIFAMHMIALRQGIYNLDELRHARERMAPAEYLQAGYWERDLVGLEVLLVENGHVSQEELDEYVATFDGDVPTVEDEEVRQLARDKFERDRFSDVPQVEPSFAVGDEVLVKNVHPAGHTRIPRYVRDKRGVVRKEYGSFHLPDAAVDGRDAPEPCYSVRFDAAEIWGTDTSADTLCIDMWESYLEPG